ncbi:ankyrin repeat, PH and SEC7 domain containing protein secG-like [Mercenaria mercenaria]|uniref:ankyrin repeat, PH and SEC7 domain containing protein secG-like n=1 Tax=Mercenaria mercenaria TaxID=6596 RepID=UPI001E1DC6F8|nr:ankyrin repeat, PH and SEC7 domain containing protein secG-like [Mercenaria mercenaria]
MEILDKKVSPGYALQCIKSCAENGETTALEEHLRLHKPKLTDELIPVLCDAFLQRHDGEVKIVLSALDQEIRTYYSKNEKTATNKLLCLAIERGDRDIVLELIDKGASVNGHIYGKPLLHIAACHGHFDIVTELMKAGADIDSVDRRGDGIIHSILTCQLKNKGPMVCWVVNLGANTLVKSSSGKLPIHLAAKNDRDALVEIIRHGHDVNTPDDVNNETPLHIACGAVCRETIQELIHSGCRFNMVNNLGETPLAKLLRFTSNVHDFHTKTRLGIAKVLISIGFQMNSQSQKTSRGYSKGRDKCYDRYVSLKMSLNTPPSLQTLARRTVRDSLTPGSNLQKEINKLDIPKNLKWFIMFQDWKL